MASGSALGHIFGKTAAGDKISKITNFDLGEYGAPFIACFVILKLKELSDEQIGAVLKTKFRAVVPRGDTIDKNGAKAVYAALTGGEPHLGFYKDKTIFMKPAPRVIEVCAN